MKNKRIVVTGATGFLGSTFVRMFSDVGKKIGYNVVPLLLRFDDPAFSRKLHDLHPPDYLVHLGAKVDLAAPLEDLLLPNTLATYALADWARDSYFMYASSVMVHGATTKRIKADTGAWLDTGYGHSKWLGEMAVRSVFGDDCLILRLAGVYGNGGRHMGLNQTIRQAQDGVKPTLYGDGAGMRNYNYVVDVVKTMVFCLKSLTTGTHLVASDQPVSIADMVESVCEVFMVGQPNMEPGAASADQIVERSPALPNYVTGFRDSLRHMKYWNDKESGK